MNGEEMVNDSVRAVAELDQDPQGEKSAFTGMLYEMRVIRSRYPTHPQMDMAIGALAQLSASYDALLPPVYEFPQDEYPHA